MKMSRIIIYVKGGVVQDVLADSRGIEVMIVNYDDEECLGKTDRSFQPVRCDKPYFEQTLAGIEV